MLGNLPERLRIAQRDKRIVGKFCQRYAFPIGIPVSLGHSHAHLLIVQQDGACRHLVPRYRGIEQQVAALGRTADAQIQIAVLGGKPREYLADTLRARQRTDAQTTCPVQALLDFAACVALGFQYRPCVPQQDISLLGAAQSLSRSLE